MVPVMSILQVNYIRSTWNRIKWTNLYLYIVSFCLQGLLRMY